MTDKIRQMTPKGFLFKSNSAKVSPAAFIAAHREWLLTGKLAEVTSPILAKLDAKELYPTMALSQVKEAVLAHHLTSEIEIAEAAMNAPPKESAVQKNYLATVFDSEGNIAFGMNSKGEEVSLQKEFALPQEASRWVDRRLEAGAVDWYGEVASLRITGKDGCPITERIERADAVSRLLRKPLGPVTHTNKAASGRLGFGVKASQSHCHFSKG